MKTNLPAPVKFQPALTWLVLLIALLALINSGAGIFWQGGDGPFTFTTLHGQTAEIYGWGIYQNDTTLIAAGNRGVDAVVLLLGLPLLAISYFYYRRGSLRGSLILAGMLSYFLYIGFSLTFSVAFNSLFLVYTALFSASLFALFAAFASIDSSVLAARIQPSLPHRGLAVFLFVAGLGTFLLWLSDLLGPILQGGVPANLGPYTTTVTHGLDSATITPVAVLTGVYLLRRKALGYLLAPPLMILCILNGVNVLAATAVQTMAGVLLSPGVYIGMVGSWVVMGGFAIWLLAAFFRNLTKKPTPGKTQRRVPASS
jgi:hypothetical protein